MRHAQGLWGDLFRSVGGECVCVCGGGGGGVAGCMCPLFVEDSLKILQTLMQDFPGHLFFFTHQQQRIPDCYLIFLLLSRRLSFKIWIQCTLILYSIDSHSKFCRHSFDTVVTHSMYWSSYYYDTILINKTCQPFQTIHI